MERDPILGRAVRESLDAVELRDRTAEFAVAHVVEPLRGEVAGVSTGIDLGPVKLAFVRYGRPTRVVAEGTGSDLCWTIPIGEMAVTLDRHRGVLSEGFLLDRSRPTVMVPHSEQGAVIVTTSEVALRAHQRKLAGADAPSLTLVPGPSRFQAKGQVELAWRYVANSLALAGSPPRGMALSLGETLLTALLAELQPIGRLLPSARPGDLHGRRAAQWAEQNFTSAIQVSDWAKAVNVSVRHLQAVIRAEYGCTPKEYLTELRLQRARELLRDGGQGCSVTSVAAAAGFSHLGRFAGLYRERFGVAPSLDRR